MKYNIIGDIHCRDVWKKLVREDCVNIFVGDYFSPYHNVPFEEQLNNFMDIILFKHEHPNTIMLIGNHDDQHWKNIDKMVTRFNHAHQKEIAEVLEGNKDYLQVSYSIENKFLVTHAGVSIIWYGRKKNKTNLSNYINLNIDEEEDYISLYDNKKTKDDNPLIYSNAKDVSEAVKWYYDKYYTYYAEENKVPNDGTYILWKNQKWVYNAANKTYEQFDITPDELSVFINDLWNNGKYNAFNFKDNSDHYDTYGESSKQGPMWLRPNTLADYDIFNGTGYGQIVGHTMFEHVTNAGNLYFVDCLEYSTESLIINVENNNVTTEINKPV